MGGSSLREARNAALKIIVRRRQNRAICEIAGAREHSLGLGSIDFGYLHVRHDKIARPNAADSTQAMLLFRSWIRWRGEQALRDCEAVPVGAKSANSTA